MDNRIINNQVTISGGIVSEFLFSHEVFGEKFYVAELSAKRTSGTADILPIMVSDRLVDVSQEWKGQIVKVGGQLRTYNKHEGEKNRLILSVFVREFEAWEDDGTEMPNDENTIFLDGFICKKPVYRKTPLGREIADILLAVNRPYGKSDYIPCIIWGRNASFVSRLEVRTHVQICGRLQSREYQKKNGEDEIETRIAYEVSASRIEVVEETEEVDD